MPIVEGCPDPLLGADVVALEAGITLGELGLGETAYTTLHDGSAILSLRIDDHPIEDGWKTLAPDGSVIEERTFTIPLTPVAVPADAFRSDRALSEWTYDTHGALGRLLLWNDPMRWWILSHPDLETTLICAPADVLSRLWDDKRLRELRQTPVATWIPTLTAEGQAEAAALARRYGLAAP